MQDAVATATYRDMVDQIKAYHKLEDRGLVQPPKIVIAERPGEHNLSQRILTNGNEVAASLKSHGFDAQVSQPSCTPGCRSQKVVVTGIYASECCKLQVARPSCRC